MLIAIIGAPFAGKSSVENYLVSCKGFTSVRIAHHDDLDLQEFDESSLSDANAGQTITDIMSKHKTFPSMSPLQSSAATPISKTLDFHTLTQLLIHVTQNWRSNYVTKDLCTRRLVEPFIRRPFFLLLRCHSPLLQRFRRSKRDMSLEEFIVEDDRVTFGSRYPQLSSEKDKADSLTNMADLVNIDVINSFGSLQGLYSDLDSLDLLHPEHLRPSWDAYFMTLASLASRRSNCMKRRVGAILVRENRVLATGYNGTPRGLKNCNEGGCTQCNGRTSRDSPPECLCLHAEENALLEAGRERVGQDCVLYCNTCPCLRCSIKIIQTGVKLVVYNLTYKVDDASAALFKEAGVQLRRYDPGFVIQSLKD